MPVANNNQAAFSGMTELSIFSTTPYALVDNDTLEDVMLIAENMIIGGGNPPIMAAVAPLKNPCSPYLMCVYFLQKDIQGRQVSAEFLDITQPITVSATLHDENMTPMASIGPIYNMVNPAEHMFFMNELRRVYMSMPYILKK